MEQTPGSWTEGDQKGPRVDLSAETAHTLQIGLELDRKATDDLVTAATTEKLAKVAWARGGKFRQQLVE